MVRNIYILLLEFNKFSITVPTESPQDLQVEAISSNSVTVVWVEPDIEFHNGIIRHYIVNVSSQSLEFDLITSDTVINISGLNPFTNYTVTVAAFTVGNGPSSVALSFITMEARKTPYYVCYSST